MVLQVDKELASGEYFLKEKERVAKKKELKKVRKALGMKPWSPRICCIIMIQHTAGPAG